MPAHPPRLPAGAAALLALALAPAAAAQDMAPADPLEGCVAAHLPRGAAAAAGACLGAVSGPCIADTAGDAAWVAQSCLQREQLGWERMRAEARLRRMRRLMEAEMRARHEGRDPGGAVEAAEAANRAWEAWRSAECAARVAARGAGEPGRLVEARCLVGLTAAQALEMRAHETGARP